jgi:hypothetical protein
MVKTLEDADSLRYKKQFDELSERVNPKPSPEEIEILKQSYIDRRIETSITIPD